MISKALISATSYWLSRRAKKSLVRVAANKPLLLAVPAATLVIGLGWYVWRRRQARQS